MDDKKVHKQIDIQIDEFEDRQIEDRQIEDRQIEDRQIDRQMNTQIDR